MDTAAFDIVGIGMAVFDMVMMVPAFPAEDSKGYASSSFVQGGGPCATALAAASRLGARAAYVGTVGDDFFGCYIAEDLARFGVDTTHLRMVPGGQSHHSMVLSSAAGSRTVVTGAASAMGYGPLPEAVIRRAKYLHLDAHEMDLALPAARLAKDAGVAVSLDAGSPYPGIDELLPLVDVLVPSENFVRRYTGCGDVAAGARQLVERYRPRVFAVTLGPKGGLVLDGDALVPYPAFAVDAVDSNGAGDVFHGAFLAALLRGEAPRDDAAFASATAAITCTRPGARGAVPTREDVLAFMAAPAL